MKRSSKGTLLVVSCLALGITVGCGGSQKKTNKTIASAGNAEQPKGGFSKNDHARCTWQGEADRDVVESTAAGAFQPNIRRVYKVVGTGIDRRKVMICREVDTNLDGVKDIMRTFNDMGEPDREEADTNYDGHVDTWTFFGKGRIVKQQRDTNHDGKANVWKFYVNGKVARVQRDNNHDGKPDVWENYIRGRLDRIGVDIDFDGRVDRWDRDEMAHAVKKTKKTKKDAADAGTASQDSDAGDGGTDKDGKS